MLIARGGQCPHPARWAVPTPGSQLSCAPSVMVYARGSKGTAGASRPRPSPEGRMALWTPVRGIMIGWRPGSRRASRACGGHASQRARRDAVHARFPPIRHGTAVTPSPPGKGAGLRALGRGSPTVAPLRVTLRAPPQLREAASSCGGRRRLLLLLRPCTVAECRSIPDLACHSASRITPDSATGPSSRTQRGRPTGAARPPADEHHNTQSPSKPPPRGSH